MEHFIYSSIVTNTYEKLREPGHLEHEDVLGRDKGGGGKGRRGVKGGGIRKEEGKGDEL